MGGLTPPTSLSQAVFPPPQDLVPGVGPETMQRPWTRDPLGKPRRGKPFGGVSRVIHPQMAPLILGLLGFAREYSLVELLPILTDFSRLSWEIILSQ